MKTQTNIIVTLQMEGFHRWDGAFEEVAFLKDDHRHIFHFELEVPVQHDDRDVEIILFKRIVQRILIDRYGDSNGVLQLGSKSCEMLAKELLVVFECDRVKVTEDGENGAVVYLISLQ